MEEVIAGLSADPHRVVSLDDLKAYKAHTGIAVAILQPLLHLPKPLGESDLRQAASGNLVDTNWKMAKIRPGCDGNTSSMNITKQTHIFL